MVGANCSTVMSWPPMVRITVSGSGAQQIAAKVQRLEIQRQPLGGVDEPGQHGGGRGRDREAEPSSVPYSSLPLSTPQR